MDLTLAEFVDAVGTAGDVTISGAATRGGPVLDVRAVGAPVGIVTIDRAEMTAVCGAGTAVDVLLAELASVGQTVGLPAGGTVGGALAVGRSDIRRLRYGALRDAVLQIRYASAAGTLITGGGPTVKNVSGFDMCRLFVGSWGTLGFLGEVTLRTRPLPAAAEWFESATDPWTLLRALYRPASVLWDGSTTTVLLEGHPSDLAAAAAAHSLVPTSAPTLPTGGRSSHPPAHLAEAVDGLAPGTFAAEIGVGVVHHAVASAVPPRRPISGDVRTLHRRIKDNFDPNGRLNPGIDVLEMCS